MYVTTILFIVVFLTGCQSSSNSNATPSNSKIYLYAEACDSNENVAKTKVFQSLEQNSSLPSISRYSSLKLKEDEPKFCYEASVNAHQWHEYSSNLEKRAQRILQMEQEQNSTRFYSEKSSWIDTLLIARHDFNTELKQAGKIAPVLSVPLDTNRTRLMSTLNTKPSVKMDYRPCKHRSNYKCQLGFVSKVKDEDKRLSYVWDFGDGHSSTHKNPLYTYVKEGKYTITLSVKDSADVKSSVSTTIKVAKSRQPFAKFRTQKAVYTSGERITFKNYSYSDTSKITHYSWNFGDGKTSTQKNSTHSYHKQGRYFVTLKACSKNWYCSKASKKLKIKEVKALIDAKQGSKIEDYVAEHGEPSEKIVKAKALMTAYKYGHIWLLSKRGKIECAVKEEGLSTNLMGQPKKCYWHERHAKEYMVELK